MRTYVVLILTMSCLSYAPAAQALPAPWSEEELIAASDAVLDAEVIEVICLGEPIETPQKTTTYYRSTLVPLEIEHGDLPNPFYIEFFIEAWNGMPPEGGWSEPAHPIGQKATLYLETKGEPELYGIVWWNGMTSLPDSAPQPLPDCSKPLVEPSPEPLESDIVSAADVVAEDTPAPEDLSAPVVGGHNGSGCAATGTEQPAGILLLLLLLLGGLTIRNGKGSRSVQ